MIPSGRPTSGQEKRQYLTQVKLDSYTHVNPVCFTTTLTQTFHNPNQDPLPHVRYTFPLFDGICVNSYTIEYAGQRISGIVQQNQDAKQTYQAAVDHGKTAGLLESMPAGVFAVTLGNVPEGDLIVNIVYGGELKHDASIDGLRYMLPTSIAPRYGDYPGAMVPANAISKGGISITVDIDMGGSAIRKIQSPSHPIAIASGSISTADQPATFSPSQASATLALHSAELGGDFILQISIDDVSKPQAVIERHPDIKGQRALMMTMVPRFSLPVSASEIVFIADQSGSMAGGKNTALVQALKVFLKSLPFSTKFNIIAFGTSYESLWPQSQAYNESNVETALAFVNGFRASRGSTELLKPITATFDQRFDDLPLEVMILTDGAIWKESPVFSYINSKLQSEPGKSDANARIFSLGIGSDVSHSLVEGIARAGNGFAQFVTQNEDTDSKVLRMLKGALYTHTKDYELEVHYQDDQEGCEDDFEIVEKVQHCLNIDDDESAESSEPPHKKQIVSFFSPSADIDELPERNSAQRYLHLPIFEPPKILQAPSTIPPLFPFNRSTVYLLLSPEACQKTVTAVTVRAKTVDGTPLEITVPVQATKAAAMGTSTVHLLAARKAIQDLEDGRGWLHAATVDSPTGTSERIKDKYPGRFDEMVEREAVRLGVNFQVAGRWTSFVAVQQANDREQVGSETRDDLQTATDLAHDQVSHSSGKRKNGAAGKIEEPTVTLSPAGHSNQLQRNRLVESGTSTTDVSVSTGLFDSATSSRYASSTISLTHRECGANSSTSGISAGMAPRGLASGRPRARQSTGGKAPRKQLCTSAARKSAPSSARPAPQISPDTLGAKVENAAIQAQPLARECAVQDHQPANPHVAKMYTLISMQSFVGAWVWSQALASFLEIDEQKFRELVSSYGARGVERETQIILATAMAVEWLRVKVPEKHDVWGMIVGKATTWLKGQIGERTRRGKKLHDVMELVKTYV
nr:von willebrand factor a domain-containing protein [Quercus suber]